jgi:hypothetical protein
MRSSAAMIAHDGIESDSLPAFLSDLSALCRKHGFGIGGQPEIFILEPDDYAYDYSVDPEGRLVFGG